MKYSHFLNRELAIILLALIFFVFADKFIVQTTGSPDILAYSPYILIAIPLLIIAIFFKLETWGLMLLILAMFTSPRFPIGTLAHGRAIDIRVEDILLIFLCFAWFLRFKHRPPQKTPFLPPILIYLGISILSTSTAIYFNRINLAEGLFYLLKEVEYFFIFFLVANNITHKRQLSLLIWIFLGIGVADFCWKINQIFVGVAFVPGALFEQEHVLQSSVAALYPLAIVIGLWPCKGNSGKQIGTGVLALLFITSLLLGGKRGIVAGVVGGIGVMGLWIFERKRTTLAILCLLIISCLVLYYFLPEIGGLKRMASMEQNVGSAHLRLNLWDYNIKSFFFSNPVLGTGKSTFSTSSGAHNFYVRLLCEVGLVGFFAFVWLWGLLWRETYRFFRSTPDRLYRAISLSWLFVTAAIAVSNFTGDYLLTVRSAEPYWFISGIIVGMSELARKEST